MVFPSFTICNLNQVEASFLKENNAYGNITRTNILHDEFIRGRNGTLSQADELFVNEIIETLGIDVGWSFLELSTQSCANLFISITFRGMKLTWDKFVPGSIGPIKYPTDFGSCCYLVPHLDLRPYSEIENMNVKEMYFDLQADALNGETNGVDLVIDAEQFNYAYHHSNSAGFKIAMHHHLDKPMIQFSSQLIFPGSETQINLKPTISKTTDAAISLFDPEERKCYAEGEANLTYLRYDAGFRYEMNNCLIDHGIRDIIWHCRCMPSFGYVEEYLKFIPMCTGEKLLCANTRMKSIGMKRIPFENNIIVPEALNNPTMIGNISIPDAIDCMPACTIQENNNQMSFAPYPQRGNFFYQETFCRVASHIWQKTCQNENREFFIRKEQPTLCPILKSFKEYFEDDGVMVKNSTVRTPPLKHQVFTIIFFLFQIDDSDYTENGDECENKCQLDPDDNKMWCLDLNGTWAHCLPFACKTFMFFVYK